MGKTRAYKRRAAAKRREREERRKVQGIGWRLNPESRPAKRWNLSSPIQAAEFEAYHRDKSVVRGGTEILEF